MTLLLPLIFLYQGYRYVSGKSRQGWAERWGKLPPAIAALAQEKKIVWVHAVSAGEVVAAVPILRELNSRLPDYSLVLSVITPAGYEMAQQQAANIVSGIFYAPFDLFWVVKRVVRTLKPAAFVSLESEMWPNLLYTLQRSGCVNVLVNGRMSDRSYQRIEKRAGKLFRWMIGNISRMYVQSEADAGRFRALMPSERSEHAKVLGNSKFDQAIDRLTPERVLGMKRSLHLPPLAPVLVAGSTRSAEEESQILTAYATLLSEFPDLCLIVAPRQIDRADELEAAMRQRGLKPIRKTGIDAVQGEVQQIILDTMGELANVYAVASVTFVGNSFEPVVKGGGQNLLQPLAHGKPVFYGPKIATIRSEAALAQEHGVGFQVADSSELATEAALLLENPERLQNIAGAAVAMIESNRGVSERYALAVIDACRLTSVGVAQSGFSS